MRTECPHRHVLCQRWPSSSDHFAGRRAQGAGAGGRGWRWGRTSVAALSSFLEERSLETSAAGGSRSKLQGRLTWTGRKHDDGVWRWGYELIFEVHSLGSWSGEGLLARSTPKGPSSGSSKPCTHKKLTRGAGSVQHQFAQGPHSPPAPTGSLLPGPEKGRPSCTVAGLLVFPPDSCPPSAATVPLLGDPALPAAGTSPPLFLLSAPCAGRPQPGQAFSS